MQTRKLNINTGSGVSIQVPANSMYVFIKELEDSHTMKLRDLSNFYLEHRVVTPKALYVDLEYNSVLVLVKINNGVLENTIYSRDFSCPIHELGLQERFIGSSSEQKKEVRLIKTMLEKCQEYLYDAVLKDVYKNIKDKWITNDSCRIAYNLNQYIQFKSGALLTHYNVFNNSNGNLSLNKVKQTKLRSGNKVKLVMNEVIGVAVIDGNKLIAKVYISTHLGLGEVIKADGILGKVLEEQHVLAEKCMQSKKASTTN